MLLSSIPEKTVVIFFFLLLKSWFRISCHKTGWQSPMALKCFSWSDCHTLPTTGCKCWWLRHKQNINNTQNSLLWIICSTLRFHSSHHTMATSQRSWTKVQCLFGPYEAQDALRYKPLSGVATVHCFYLHWGSEIQTRCKVPSKQPPSQAKGRREPHWHFLFIGVLSCYWWNLNPTVTWGNNCHASTSLLQSYFFVLHFFWKMCLGSTDV